jgi:hypothetical protein
METDPDELENLSEKPQYQKVLAELKEKLIQFQKSTNDPWYIKWQHE